MRWRENARDNLQKGTFSGSVFADDTEGLAAVYFEGDVAKRPKILVEP